MCYILRLLHSFQTPPIDLMKSCSTRVVVCVCACVHAANNKCINCFPMRLFDYFVSFYTKPFIQLYFVYFIYCLQYYLNVCRPLLPQYGLSCNANSAACRAILNGTKNPEQEQVSNVFADFIFR